MYVPDVLRPFLKYQDAVVLPRSEPITTFQMTEKKRVKPPIAVAKLNAAKASAREAFLASKESEPLSPGRADSNGKSNLRKERRSEKSSKGTSMAAPMGDEVNSAASSVQVVSEPKKMLPALMRNVRDATQILYALFPPIMVPLPETDESAVQFVSTTQASREEVVKLHDQLVDRLEKRYARPSGYCPIRREIYDDVLCELIRQLTLEEPARGVLLQRLKDEAHKSLKVHSDLAQRAEYFSSRKLLSCSEGIREMEDTIAELGNDIAGLQVKLHALDEKRRAIERKYDEERQERIKPQQDELAYWRRANQQLSLRLKTETEKAAAANSALEDQL